MLKNSILAVASTVLFIVLVEGALRLSGRVPTDAVRSPDLQTLDAIPGLFQPGQDFVDRILPDLPYRVRINALGFRGAEVPETKPPGTVRVLCVGDSYTFGPYVDDQETFPAALGRLLDAPVPGEGPAVEVVNAGANGFTLRDELAFLKDKGLGIAPDIVVLIYTQNDIADLARSRPQIEVMRDHARLKSRFLVGPAVKLLQRSAIFNGMQRTAAWLKVRRRRAAAASGADNPAALWEAYGALLRETAELTRRRGVRLLLVAWPSHRQVEGLDPFTPLERVGRLAAGAGVPFLDLTPAVKELEARKVKAYLTPRDGHPTAEGYGVAARAASQRLLEMGWIVARRPGWEEVSG